MKVQSVQICNQHFKSFYQQPLDLKSAWHSERNIYRFSIFKVENASNMGKASGLSQNHKKEVFMLTTQNELKDVGLNISDCIQDSGYEEDDDEYDEIEDRHDQLSAFTALVLDVSYRPVNVVCWKRALCLEILEKAEVLVYYDQIVCSPNKAFFIPAVLRNNYLHSPKRKKIRLGLNRNNVFMRDNFQCQYCDGKSSLTIDHVIPASRGGSWTWENLVTACHKCNNKKGDKTPEEARMNLNKYPKEPKPMDSKNFPSNYKALKSIFCRRAVPSEWLDYLPLRPEL